MPPPFEKYGLRFTQGQDALWVELYFIKNGGRWIKDGHEVGLGLFEHMMNARKLLWPNRYRHRWTDLMYHEFIKNDLTVLLGSASSQKTSHAVEYCLLNYWARPEKTLVILSTVNMDKLDIGVYAELKMLWKSGKDRFPWLAGHLLEHKRAISTDVLSETGNRDFRKGVIGRPCYTGGRWVGLGILAGVKQEYIFYVADECFPPGTLVDTPLGPRRIETLRPGDAVVNATGVDTVLGVRVSTAKSLCRITMRDGRQIDCTANHKFLTQKGWIKAVDMSCEHYILGTYEAMSILRENVPHEGAFPMVSEVSEFTPVLRDVRQRVPSKKNGFDSAFLRDELLRKMETHGCLDTGQGLFQSKEREGQQGEVEMAFGAPRVCRSAVRIHEGPQPHAWEVQPEQREGIQGNPLQLQNHLSTREGIDGNVGIGTPQIELSNSRQIGRGSSLQNRRGCPASNAGNRSRWKWPFDKSGACEGQEKRCFPKGSWVDGCEILQPSNTQASGSSEHGARVYNLHIARHHSYSVLGLVAQNCQFMQEAFSASWPHLFSNGQVKIIASGNPKHDPDDELGKTAEPKEGWGAYPEPQKTDVWDTKFMGGRCINLVGTDSPNFDFPANQPVKYPGLISRKFVERINHDYGPDSFEAYRLVKGVMKVAFAHSRVITRQLCRDHGASEKAEWADDKRQRVYWLDPSYGGEDACAGGCLEWGVGLNGATLIRLVGYRLYRFNLNSGKEVEDQIADILAEELNLYGVDSTDAFYDSTGKGTLGGAFARKFGTRAPVAVDSGGRPSNRPVRQDLWVDEDDGKKRLKRCDEHYSKFISEMWFSVRYCIEAGQMRELPDEFITEGCARIYEVVAGNKIEVESKSDPKKKEDLKRRLGHSPNLFDGLAVGLQGARIRGFLIANLAPPAETETQDEDFFETEAREFQDTIAAKLLTH